MLKLEFDEQLMEQLAEKISASVSEKVLKKIELQNQWPPMLNREKLMQFLDIKANKASELLKRPDFPVNRECGHPKVPTHLLIKWIEDNTQWVKENSGYFDKQTA